MSQKDQAGGDEPAGGDFVSRLVSDPAKPPQTTLLSGYVGASDEEGHTRIYFDPQLSDYVDVADDDVLHTEPAGGTGPLSPTLVWIKRDAQVLHGQAGSTRQRAGFFEGRVWRENFGVTAAGQGAQGPRRRVAYGPPAPRPLSARPCPSVVGCRTPVHPCAGPVSANPCPTVQACHTRAPFCAGPSAVDACPTARCVTQGCVGPEGSSGGAADTAVQGSGGPGADAVSYGSPAGTDTVNYGSLGAGTDTVSFGPDGTGADTVFQGSGGGTDTVLYGSTDGTDTVYYGSGGGADTVYYGSGGGADTVIYGSGGGGGTVRYGGPAILPSEWCPSAGLPCPPRTLGCPPPTFRCPPRTMGCPPPTFGCPPRTAACPPQTFGCPPRTAFCPRTLGSFCPNPSAVDACPTRICQPR